MTETQADQPVQTTFNDLIIQELKREFGAESANLRHQIAALRIELALARGDLRAEPDAAPLEGEVIDPAGEPVGLAPATD